MEWTRRRIWALIFVGFITVFVAAPVLGAVFDNTVEQSGDVSYVAPNGPNATVVGDTNVSLDDPSQVFPFSNTVNLTTEAGNFTAISNGPTNFSIETGEITGTYTNISEVDANSNQLTVNPEDKVKLTLDGAATQASWTQYELDDGTVDLVISGPDNTKTKVTFYDLQPSTTVSAVNKSLGTPLAVGQTDSNGQVTLEIEHSEQTVLLQTGDASTEPTQSNPSPTGRQNTPPGQISIDINDSDFPDDNVSVTIDLDGSQVKSTNITSNSTVTASISPDLGTHTWTVNATDKYGNINEQEYEFKIPHNLTFRNETNASEIITGVNATVTFYGDGGNVVVQLSDDDNDGNISMESLPDAEFVAEVSTDNFYERNVYIGSIYEQQNIYLLNKTAYPRTTDPAQGTAIRTIFSYEDRTGNFPSGETKLRIQRAVDINNDNNSTYETAAGDFFGAAGEIEFIGEYDERYRLIIENEEGTQRDLGPFEPTADRTKSLTVGDIRFPEQNGTGRYFDADLEVNNTRILVTYNDDTELTEDITLTVHERGDPNNVIFKQRYSGPFGKLNAIVDLTENQTEQEWAVTYESSRDGEDISGKRLVGGTPLDWPLDPLWSGTLAFGFITIIGSLYGPRTAKLGGVTMVIVAAMFMYFQIVFIAVPMLFIAAFIALGGVLYDEGRP